MTNFLNYIIDLQQNEIKKKNEKLIFGIVYRIIKGYVDKKENEKESINVYKKIGIFVFEHINFYNDEKVLFDLKNVIITCSKHFSIMDIKSLSLNESSINSSIVLAYLHGSVIVQNRGFISLLCKKLLDGGVNEQMRQEIIESLEFMVKEIVKNVETIRNNQELIKYLLSYTLISNKDEYVNNENNLRKIDYHLKLICKIIKNAEDNIKKRFVEDGNNIFLLLEKLLTCGKMNSPQIREILDIIENLLPEQEFDLNEIIKRPKIEIINT
jgi:hypothetical protein